MIFNEPTAHFDGSTHIWREEKSDGRLGFAAGVFVAPNYRMRRRTERCWG